MPIRSHGLAGARLALSHWLAVVLMAFMLLPGRVLAHDYITERAWLEDPSGQASWSSIRQQSGQPFSGMLSKGFGHSSIWVRLRIDPARHPVPAHDPDRLVLRIRPVYLDDIQVYDALSPQGLIGRTGDIYHPRLDVFQGLDFMVPIDRGTQPRDIWLSMRSTSTRQIDVQVMDIEALNHHTQTQALFFSMHLGLVAVLGIWGLVHWAFTREALIGVFGVTQTVALAFALSSLGYLRAMWPAPWPAWLLDQSTTVLGVLAVSSAVWFHVRLIREFAPPLWVRHLHRALLALQPLKLGLLLAQQTTPALQLNMFEVLLNPLIFLVSVLVCTGWQHPERTRPALSRRVIVGFYAILAAVLMGAALPALGLIGGSEIALYLVQVHGLVTASLVLVLLQYRAYVINKMQRETAMALERSLLQTQQERTVREEQEKLLAMLAHELKTPLATMHMRLDSKAPGSREIRQAIRDMNGVIERCQQTLQLSDHQLAPQLERADMVSIVQDAISSCTQPGRIEAVLPEHLPLQIDTQLGFIVLNNLLENACKYAAPDTTITVRLDSHAPSGEARLEIANQPGRAGWPDASRLFEKYYRSPQAQHQAGTGLGLFLVRNLVQVMGGRIDYQPTSTRICFVLHLPLGS